MSVATRKMLSISLFTGTGSTLTLDSYPGEFSITGKKGGDTDESAVHDRGSFIQLTEGDDTPVSVSFSVYHNGRLTDAIQKKIADFIAHTGTVSGDVTTDPGGRVWALKLVATVTNGGVVDTYTCPNVRLSYDYATAKDANTLTIAGTGYHGAGHISPCSLT